eukprot:1359208-Pyramimonas_sp.AAC.1
MTAKGCMTCGLSSASCTRTEARSALERLRGVTGGGGSTTMLGTGRSTAPRPRALRSRRGTWSQSTSHIRGPMRATQDAH